MPDGWVSLSRHWTLQNTQAYLSVAVTFLCAGGIFVFVRTCWQLSARRLAKKQRVAPYTLLSLNTIGEVIDVTWLLKKDLFSWRFHGLLLQILLVLCLTVGTFLAGLIARSSTRYSHIQEIQTINGTFAQRGTLSVTYADAEINKTIGNLDRAGFPHDQLLDYLPDQDSPWVYDASQWNSSWKIACDYTDAKTFEMSIYADEYCTSDGWYQFSDLTKLIPAKINTNNPSLQMTGWQVGDTYVESMLYTYGGIAQGCVDDGSECGHIDFLLGAYQLSNLPAYIPRANESTYCTYAAVSKTTALYSQALCTADRVNNNINGSTLLYTANPDGAYLRGPTAAMVGRWTNDLRVRASRNMPVKLQTGKDLIRFYQAYMIISDTTSGPYVARQILASIQVPQILLKTLVVCSIAGFIVLAGLINHIVFMVRHWKDRHTMPQSKLDWFAYTLSANGDREQVRRALIDYGVAKNATSEGPHTEDKKRTLQTEVMEVLPTHDTSDLKTKRIGWRHFRSKPKESPYTPLESVATAYTPRPEEARTHLMPPTTPRRAEDMSEHRLSGFLQPIEDGYFHEGPKTWQQV